MTNFGEPVYSFLCVVDEEEERFMPEEIYVRSAEILKENRILGMHHLTEKGYFLEGDAKGVPKTIARFNIFYRAGCGDKTAKELSEDISTKANLNPGTVSEELEDLAHGTAELLVEADPVAGFLPWETYSQTYLIESMEVLTPAGLQYVHFHCDNGRYIRLFKPKKERYWFDIDQVKYYIFKEFSGLEKKVFETEKGFYESRLKRIPLIGEIVRLTHSWKISGRKEKSMELLKLSRALFNPDLVQRIYSASGKIDPVFKEI